MEDERGSHFDPEVLDAFKPMAMELYSACSDSSSQ
jgi:HD-GYP domain-containing protein (c-di-GMP phosphodiesterase class II)